MANNIQAPWVGLNREEWEEKTGLKNTEDDDDDQYWDDINRKIDEIREERL